MKRILILATILVLIPSVLFAAGARQRFTVMNGRAGAAASISGVSVGPNDRLDVGSGTSIEFFHAVISGASEIWPLAGGGVTGFKLSDLSGASGFFEVLYVGSEKAATTSITGVTVYDQAGIGLSGVSNLWFSQVVGGTSVSVVSDGKGGATVYYGSQGTGITVWNLGGLGGIYYSGGTAFLGENPEKGTQSLEVNGGVSATTIMVGNSGVSILIHTDNQAGVTLETTANNGDVWIALLGDNQNWRIENKGSSGGDLYFNDESGTPLIVRTDGTVTSESTFSSGGNLIGTSIYSYDTSGADGIGGIYLYTKAIAGNYVAIKIPGDGALPGNYILTLPVVAGVSGQALLTDNAGQLTFGNPTAVETDEIAIAALTAHTDSNTLTGVTATGSAGVSGQLLASDGAGGLTFTSTIDVDSINNVTISGSTIFNSVVVGGTSVWVVNTAVPESIRGEMTGGNPIITGTAYKVFNLPTLTASGATPFYLFDDPSANGVSIVVPMGSGSSIYVYDVAGGIPGVIGGQTIWAHTGGGGGKISIHPAYTSASGWYYEVLGLTGVSWRLQQHDKSSGSQKVVGKTWIGASN